MATFPHDYQSIQDKVVIRVDDSWYDVTAWRLSHPGGVEIIDKFHNQDATEAFYSLHGEAAIAKFNRMKGTPEKKVPRDATEKNFEILRTQLREDGWYKRDWVEDIVKFLLPCFFCIIVGTLLSTTHPVLATLLLGLGMQQAGWLSHDYCHARGQGADIVGFFIGACMNGLSPSWWSHKHNTHHVFPNRKEYDSDIHNEPILHLWFPEEGQDKWFRQYQHIYYPFVYSLLYVSWKVQSLQFVVGSHNWLERFGLMSHYVWLAFLPWKVALASVILAGFLVAIIVTCSHQTEPIIETSAKLNFVADQFSATRGVVCSDPISEYVFGGMQYQLEHHLFPTMPKARYPALRPIVKKFAEDNGLKYHMAGVKEIFVLGYEVMRQYSVVQPGRGGTGTH